MITIESGVKCNQHAIEQNLASWGVDYKSTPIVIKQGSWSLDVFGYYRKDSQTCEIVAYASRWYALLGETDLGISKVIYHEWCHLQGIEKCENKDQKERLSCIMYENKSAYREVMALPFQAARNFSLCDDCKKRLKK